MHVKFCCMTLRSPKHETLINLITKTDANDCETMDHLVHLIFSDDITIHYSVVKIDRNCPDLSKEQRKTGDSSCQKSCDDEGNRIAKPVRYPCYETRESHYDKTKNTLLPD